MAKNKKLNKKNKIILASVIGIIILILLIFLVKWFFFDRIVERENISMDSDVAISLTYKMKAYSYFDRLSEYSESSLTNQEKLWFVVETDELYDKSLNFYTDGNTVSGEDVKAFYKRYFGNDDIEHEDILCLEDNNPIFNYNKKTDTYQYATDYVHNHDITVIYDKYVYPVSIVRMKKANGNVLYQVKANKLFGDYCTNICGITDNFYSTYDDSLNKKNAILSREDHENWDNYFTDEQEVEKLYLEVKDDLVVYTYNFLNLENEYFLKDVKISK